MIDLVERLRRCIRPGYLTEIVAVETLQEAAAEIERLRALVIEQQKHIIEIVAKNNQLRAVLEKLHWKSIDKDNMEFRCDTTCFVMDDIRRALEPKP